MGYLEEIARKGNAANPFFVMMGIDILSYADGAATLEMEIKPEMLNGDGWLQGGVFAALCDEAMALALYTVLEEDEGIATISETTSYMRGIQHGTIRAEGRVVKKGRRVAFTEGYVKGAGDAGPLLSKTYASFTVFRK